MSRDPFRARPAAAPETSKPAPPPPASKPVEPTPAPEQPEAPESTTEGDALPSRTKLKRMREADLQGLCVERGVDFDPDGTREQLIDALEADAGRT